MPNIGFTICHLAFYFPLGVVLLRVILFKPPWASAPLSVGPNQAACGATSRKLEGWFYS